MKVKITGRAVIMTSAVATATLKTLGRFEPETLSMKDADGNELFVVKHGNRGSIGNIGVCFSDSDIDGNASLTMMIPDEVAVEKRAEWFQDSYAPALYKLGLMEDQINAAHAELADRFASVAGAITVE